MYRIQKLLSNSGYCSRRKAEELIKQDRVRVNGRVISIGDKASEDDKIYIDGKPIKKQARTYLMFNKPVGCVTALSDKKFKTVMDYIKLEQRVFPVGRLDYNTSGLLLFTNDGDFANNILHPSYEITKTYLVKTDKPINKQKIVLLEAGIGLKDGKTSPAKVKEHNPTLLEVTIHEGKNRILRRIFKQLGLGVISLKRIKVGNLCVGDLKPGKYRPLTKTDKQRIFA